MFYYDRWANDQVFDRMLRMGDVPQRDIDRMGHVVAALELWLSRIQGQGNPPTKLLAPGWSLDEGRARLGVVHEAWARVLEPLTDDDLIREIHWTRTEGGAYTALLRDIVTQLPLHGAYHRGQISITLREQLGEPLDLDYIFTTWEPAE